MAKEYSRQAHHAGSWYDDDAEKLDQLISSLLQLAISTVSEEEEAELSYKNSLIDHNHEDDGDEEDGIPRAIIAPHAGMVYSGDTAAYAYKYLHEALTKGWKGTIVVLHPSHHVYIEGCAISNAHTIETPIWNIPVDNNLRKELLQGSEEFTTMTKRTDEMEHSGEMQYPFIASIAKHFHENIVVDPNNEQPRVQILPIMVGSTSQTKRYGHLLSPILSRPNIFTVISSDFCHWGSRFGYFPTSPSDTSHHFSNNKKTVTKFNEIHEFIAWLDRQGMEHISLQDPGAFADYLKQYRNTICGRYPIALYLNALTHAKAMGLEEISLVFVKYNQSSRVKKMDESSVSYASAVARKIR